MQHIRTRFAAWKKQQLDIIRWKLAGRPAPPPHIVKQRAIKSHARKYGLKLFVETGTYVGEMVEAVKEIFEEVYSIELSVELFNQAKSKFSSDGHVHILQGDSGVVLKELIPQIQQPALFWLDGHYSAGITARGDKDTPICEELRHILDARDLGHVILIDDARCFGKDPGYPSIDQLKKFILSERPHARIDVCHDSIRIILASPGAKG